MYVGLMFPMLLTSRGFRRMRVYIAFADLVRGWPAPT
jgi:hypothetical protein